MPNFMPLHEILKVVHPVPESITGQLERIATLKIYPRRSRLVTQDTRCDAVFFIADGLCRGLYEKEDKEDTRWFASAGDVVTSITSWRTGGPAIFSIEAITEMTVYEISFNDMKAMLGEHIELRDWEIKVLIEQLYVLEKRYVILGTGDARSRYEALLNGRPQEILNAIPLKYIAQYLNITQETLSRVRKAYGKS